MTRRSSVRAQARENYYRLAAKAAPAASAATTPTSATPTPDPSPLLASARGGGEKNDLTARVRALYEDSAVPVREIAAVAGVTERTIYKYVEKHHWKRRYRVAPRGHEQDLAAAAANRERWPSPDFAPVTGAGGRFIRRDDKDKPFATGLKATDRAGRLRAAAGCGVAAQLGCKAMAQAAAAQRCERQIAAIATVNRTVKDLRAYRDACRAKGQPTNGRIEGLFIRTVDVAVQCWQALLAEDDRGASA